MYFEFILFLVIELFVSFDLVLCDNQINALLVTIEFSQLSGETAKKRGVEQAAKLEEAGDRG